MSHRTATQDTSRFESGWHPFVGVGAAPGLSMLFGWQGMFNGVLRDPQAAFMFSVRGGLLYGRFELALELSPVAYVPAFMSGLQAIAVSPLYQNGAGFSLAASVGGYMWVAGNLYWPVRLHVGFNTLNTNTGIFGGLDLAGLSYKWGHLLMGVTLLGLRFYTDFNTGGIASALFNVSAEWVF